MSNRRKADSIKVFFRVEATPELGLGHLVRCLALAEEIEKTIPSSNVAFITSSRAVYEQAKGHGYRLFKLPSTKKMIEEARCYKNEIKNSIFITSVPDMPEGYLKALKKDALLVISIDDGSDTIFHSDILLNPNLSPLIKPKYSVKTQYYGGSKYIILKKGFEKYRTKNRQINREVKSIFVCLGGADKNNITQKILNLLKEINIDIYVIVGKLYLYYDELKGVFKRYKNIKIRKNVDNIDELIYSTDLAIVSGGTLLYEVCVIGRPAIVICQNQAQEIESDFFANKKAIVNLGVFDQLDDSFIRTTIFDFFSDYKKRELFSRNAKRLIDGKGTHRIAGIIQKAIGKKIE